MKFLSLFLFISVLNTSFAGSANPVRFWPKENLPISLNVSADFNNEDILAIKAAANEWNKLFNGQLDLFSISETTTNKDYSTASDYQDAEFGVYKSYHWPADFPPGALAITQISGMRRNEGTPQERLEITHADLILNYSRKDFVFSLDQQHGTFDLKTIILHELGHFAGLYHNPADLSSVMHPYIGKNTIKRTPYYLDVKNLKEAYAQSLSLKQFKSMELSHDKSGTPFTLILELRPNGECQHHLSRGDER